MASDNHISTPNELILITGAAGFIGQKVVENLLGRGFRRLRCLVRSRSRISKLKEILDRNDANNSVDIIEGNLLSRDDCLKLTEDAVLIYHLAAGTGTKAFSEAFLNSVVTTRNLLEAALENRCLRRFVNVSSFAVYTNKGKPGRRLLDETSEFESHPESRAEAYCYGKVKQDELVMEYNRKFGLPYVILRPGTVFGPGKKFIPGRVGIDTFGFFLHLGGPNPIPLTYVDNCADAIVMAGLKPGVDGEIFNIVDDDLPSSRKFLKLYKKNVKPFKSIYIPHWTSYLLCLLWEKFSKWSRGQIPPVYTRREWAAYWKKTSYSNLKIKKMVGWEPKIPMEESLRLFFESCR